MKPDSESRKKPEPQALEALEENVTLTETVSDAELLIYGAVDEDIDVWGTPTPESQLYLDQEEESSVNETGMDGTATDVHTGGVSAGGMSDDLTRSRLGQGKRMGGPTGGDIHGAGAGGSADLRNPHSSSHGKMRPLSAHAPDTGLASKIAAYNTSEMLDESLHQAPASKQAKEP